MTDFIFEPIKHLLTWPVLAAIFALSAGWDCFSGEVQFGDYLQFDKDDTGPFIIIVGLKFVVAALILVAYYGS